MSLNLRAPAPSKNNIRQRFLPLLWGLDLAIILVLLIIALAWTYDALRCSIGPLRLTMHANYKLWLTLAALLVIRAITAGRKRNETRRACGLFSHSVTLQVLLAVLTIYVLIGVSEFLLAKSNFSAQMAPVIFETTAEDGAVNRTAGYSDPELIWKFIIGEKYDGMMINSLGYRDREVDRVKALGTKRVICMGDSVTAQGHPPYSALLNNLLTVTPPDTNRWEAFNMAVYGYSCVQGFKVFQTQTRALQPDIVTLYYGWNGHWLEMQTDRNRMARRVNPVLGKIYNLFKNKRVFMLAFNLVVNGKQVDKERVEAGFRVPPDEYVAVMTEFVAAIRSIGARPLLITAPRREVEPNQYKYPAEAAKIDFNLVHDQYVELTRLVAKQTNADLLDLHALAAAPKYDDCFSDDGIHFRQHGLEMIAKAIAHKIRDMLSQ